MAVESSRRSLPPSLVRLPVPAALSVALVAVGVTALLMGFPLVGALVLAIGTVAITVVRPAAALTAILVLFPFQPLAVRVLERDHGVSGTALVIASSWKELALGTLLVMVVAPHVWRVVREPDMRNRVRALDVFALALLVLVALGMAMSQGLGAFNQARLLLFPLGIYFVLRVGLVPAEKVMRALLASGVVVALFGIIQASVLGLDWVRHYFGTAQVPIPATFTATFLSGPRASGALGSPNEFAFLVGACAIIAIGLMVSAEQRRPAVAYGSSLFVLLPALALSFSRSTVVGFTLGAIVAVILGILAAPVRRRLVAPLLGTLIPAIFLASVLYVSRGGGAVVAGTIDTVGTLGAGSPTGSPAIPGQDSTGGGGVDASTVGHITSLTEAVRLLGANPLGIGLGNVGAHGLPGEAIDSRYVVESWYLSMGLALGLLGLVWSAGVVISMALSGARAAIRGREAAGVALAGAAVLTGVVSLVLPTMLEPQLATVPWALAACVSAVAFARRPDRPSIKDGPQRD